MTRGFTTSFIVAIFWLCGVTASSAGWLVYEIRFVIDEEESVNFSFYSGAYAVAPIGGGLTSFIFTSQDGAPIYLVAENAARLYPVANLQVRKVVLSAMTQRGSAQALYNATGLINHSLSLRSPAGGWRVHRVASALRGRLLASDDDSETTYFESPDVLGMVGSATIQARLREDLTRNSSQLETMPQVLGYLVQLLEHYGFRPEASEAEPAVTAEPLIEQEEPVQSVEEETQAGAVPTLFPPGSGVER